MILSYFDKTGVMVEPWREIGRRCYIVDVQHPKGVTEIKPDLYAVGWDLSVPWLPPEGPGNIDMFFAFPPCTDLAVSGARWFKGKGLRTLADAINLFATAQEVAEWVHCPYMIENPVSTISSYWRKPDFTFHPCDYTGFCTDDNYTKKTCLWTGNGFELPPKFIADGLGKPDDRIHKAAPSDDRADIRSATPKGFARAVYQNHYKWISAV